MHQGFEKDYRYLLSHIIPSNLLSSKRVEKIRAALEEGDRLSLIREAYLSIQELVAKGYMKRERLDRNGDTVSISYSRIDRNEEITLVMGSGEWNRITGGERRSGILSSVLAGIISSLSLNDTPRTISDRIEEILSLSGKVYPGSTAKLIILRDVEMAESVANENIKVLSWDELSANKAYRSALTSGMSHSFMRFKEYSSGVTVFPMEEQMKSLLLIPLVTKGIKWGLVEIHLPTEKPPEMEIFYNYRIVAQGILRLLENNATLEKMVAIDRLTQIYNRNHYEQQLPLEIERANRNKMRLAFLMIDIDDFKSINDTFGHDIGDQVLRDVAQEIKNHLRKIDYLFRFGGEEFVALLPGAEKESAMRTAERIRDVVARTVKAADSRYITISIGGSIYPDDAKDEEELFRRADRALYRAKREGKNRVIFYEEE